MNCERDVYLLLKSQQIMMMIVIRNAFIFSQKIFNNIIYKLLDH